MLILAGPGPEPHLVGHALRGGSEKMISTSILQSVFL